MGLLEVEVVPGGWGLVRFGLIWNVLGGTQAGQPLAHMYSPTP